MRLAIKSDIAELSKIYGESVELLAPELYTPEQVKAWADFANEAEFEDFILGNKTWLDLEGKEIRGYCGYGEDGHIASLYISPKHSRKGVGGALLSHVLKEAQEEGIKSFYTEASFLSKVLFERHGFIVSEVEHLIRNGVEFKRYKMIK